MTTLLKENMRLSTVLRLNAASESRLASNSIRTMLSDGASATDAYAVIQSLALKLGPSSSTEKPLSLALAQTSFLHGLLRRGDVYQARKMSIAFARAAAKAPNPLYPFSRRRLPIKTMSTILQALIGDTATSSFIPTSNIPPNRPSYSFLYLMSQFPTPGARAARMFVSHHAKLGDRRALRDLLVILVFGLLSIEMIGAAVAVYSQWCRKFAISEAAKSGSKNGTSASAQSESHSTSINDSRNWTTPSHVTWQPSKTLIKVLIDRLHASRHDPHTQLKGDALLQIAHLIDDRIRMGHYTSMISAISTYTRTHPSSLYTQHFEHILECLADDIASGKLLDSRSTTYKRVKEFNASSYNALIHHFAHARDMHRVELLLSSFADRHGAIRSDSLNALLSASVQSGNITLAARLVDFLQWKLNKNRSDIFPTTQTDHGVMHQLKRTVAYYTINDETISVLLKYYVAIGKHRMVKPLTYQHLPHLDLNKAKEEREGALRKMLDEQSSSDLFAALHRTLKTGLAVRLLNDRQLYNLSIESLTSLMAIMAQEASKHRTYRMSLGWGPRRWIRAGSLSKSYSDILNEKQYKRLYDSLKLRCNSATYLAATIYKNVRHRPSKHHVGRCDVSIDEGFLRLCLKTFSKSNYTVAIDDVLVQYIQRGFTPPPKYSDRLEWVSRQDPLVVQSSFNKSRVPIILPKSQSQTQPKHIQ
ncbi:hypothetical protein E3P99_00669 [Wallemia hederae]|uniref:Uncharacterized protein n=1 Tax=Wallemia hederae TaxID=1540922 RepID=A0A4T0FZ50_9BASI|nr:hypothetical protein E3P99_00669 [Wallemia hederae]